MTKNEFMKVAVAIKSAYPAAKVMDDDASLQFWYMMLKDFDYQTCENATIELIATSKYPPSIATLRAACTDRCKTPVMSFDEAWGVVMRTIRKYGPYQYEEAMNYLSKYPLIESIVRNFGWSNICNGVEETTRANFRMAYEQRSKDAATERILPDFVRTKKTALQSRNPNEIEAEKGALTNIEKRRTSNDTGN